jgi:class 3 adenylate cyclase
VICPSCGKETPEGFPRCANCGAPLEAALATREQRKTVTIMICDLVHSTALAESDPEVFRRIQGRYFDRSRRSSKATAGSWRSSSATRSWPSSAPPGARGRRAQSLQSSGGNARRLPELGVQARIGVNTGEVVPGTEERLATGDPVNVGARLEQAAQPGEILIGDSTLQLVRDVVEVEAVEPLELKGKAEPVAAHRRRTQRQSGARSPLHLHG